MSSKKKSIQAKIVMHAHRKRFQEYIRQKGRDKMTIGYVYWNMYFRSGKGNVFELKEDFFLADLGIGKNSLRPARKMLVDDGWLSKGDQKIDPLTGKWGTTAWIVNTNPVAHSEGGGTATPLTGDRPADDGSAGDRKEGDTVVLHSQYASNPEASTSPVPQKQGGTSSKELVSKPASESLTESLRSNPITTNQNPLTTEEQDILDAIMPVRDKTQDGRYKTVLGNILGTGVQFGFDPVHLLRWNRKTKKGGLYIRTPEQYWTAILGNAEGTYTMLNEYKASQPRVPDGKGFSEEPDPKAPCSRCKGSTYGRPTVEGGRTYCPDCMKLPQYRRQSGQRDILGKGDDLSIVEPDEPDAVGRGFDVTDI